MSSRCPQLILAGASVRAAAMSACRAGYYPRGLDLFCDHDLQSCATQCETIEPYPSHLRALFPALPNDAWMYTGGLENHPDLIDELANMKTLYGNRGDVLRKARDPFLLADLLTSTGFAMPPMQTSPQGLPRDGGWLQKRSNAAGGAGVSIWNAAVSVPASTAHSYYYQQRISGQPCGAAYVAARGQALLLGVTNQRCGILSPSGGTADFRYAGSVGPVQITTPEQAQLARLGNHLARTLNLTGLFGVDFIRTSDQWWVLEVNPRYTASIEILEWATGCSSIALHVAACRDGKIETEQTPTATRIAGKRVLYARQDGLASATLLAKATKLNAACGAWPRIADIPQPGIPVQQGQPLITVLAAGYSQAEVERQLDDAAATIDAVAYQAR